MSVYYPPVGFYFVLSFFSSQHAEAFAFQEVSGITDEMQVEEIVEGGENRFKYHVPTGTKHSNLVVKRGLILPGSILAKWCRETIGADFSTPIQPKTIYVKLMDAEAAPLMVWQFMDAWPVKWAVSDLKPEGKEIVIESIEFAYYNFSVLQNKMIL